MGKIICEICGTEYPDTAQECPVCGYTHNGAPEPEEPAWEPEQEPYPDLSDMPPMPGRGWDPLQAEETPQGSPEHPMFDFDAVNPQDDPEPVEMPQAPEGYVEYEDLGEEGPEGPAAYGPYETQPMMPQKQKQPVFLIILLVILNVILLAATAFLFFKYLLPGKLSETPVLVETTVVTETTAPETTAPSIPCTSLVMTSSGKVELNSKGQFWLIHAKAMPENTTDKIMYFTEDESVATVNEEGRVTAVGEGETKIAVVCGLQQMICPVKVIYKEVEETLESLDAIMPTEAEEETEETKAAEETKTAEEAEAKKETEEAQETEPAETEKPKKPVDPNITLKLKKTDILFQGMGRTAQLELDCDLSPEDVEWTSAYPNIIKVENGKVTTLQYGASRVTAKYGDQEASCVVRCVKSGT